VVEDEDAVRNLARRVLSAAGYTVLTAPNGAEALRLCEAVQSDIQLLLTDVVMPQMGGVDLARRLAAGRPGLRVLFMSGYADQPGADQAPPAPDAPFLAKPFEPAALARKVREVIDSPAAFGPPSTESGA
jgi:CheY-like chemotaxis protein